ncbi:5884_t:CDS:2, partial [Acaulospora colombiana]
MQNNQKIVMQGEADQEPGVETGDVILVLKQKPHDKFERQGNDLLAEVNITITEALCGFSKVLVVHLDGRGLVINHPAGEVIKPGTIKCIPNEGMPQYKRQDDKGNLYLRFSIEFPPSLWITPERLKDLEAFLLPRDPENSSDQPEILDEVQLADADLSEYGEKKGKEGNIWDEDEEDDDEQPVGCTPQ